MIRKICKDLGIDMTKLYELFPTGPAKGACKLAGLSKPTGCVWKGCMQNLSREKKRKYPMGFYILSYLCIAVFIVATGCLIYRQINLPLHVRWEIYPVQHETDRKGGLWWFLHGRGELVEQSIQELALQ